jgi:hypothetical protein
MAYLAKDLSPEQRLAIESLLGRSLSEKEAIAIRVYKPAVLSSEGTAEIIAALEAYFGALDAAREPAHPGKPMPFSRKLYARQGRTTGPTREDRSRRSLTRRPCVRGRGDVCGPASDASI